MGALILHRFNFVQFWFVRKRTKAERITSKITSSVLAR